MHTNVSSNCNYDYKQFLTLIGVPITANNKKKKLALQFMNFSLIYVQFRLKIAHGSWVTCGGLLLRAY